MLSLADVLTMLATGVGIGAVIAFLAERITPFQNLPATTKTLSVIGMCAALPLVGWFASMGLGYIAWPVGAVAWIEGIFHELEVGFLAYAASQGWHLTEKAMRGEK